ncbi:transcriptional regulator Hpr [Thalassovita gelatinovora]|uniref:Transcriptional regulator Hpr n=1 Tax=Thalassovita gelatinovora TaxID=53501 RepID=A0A0P1FB61_THAGE|nr:MarR family winged helix-turn-helix transcriptional regulator [Thalassovita gelatinovora]QIZ80724.1 winged helix-turn-helix transcriptional regulator [Thalassovita gelatinovora]CUH65335.1 transcriptional regulator Hpr [Thalassovita gelatinovora]SEQ89525.1 DNA-binding transcriptional regulator, MarR family [Thalassovita gelatinovora]
MTVKQDSPKKFKENWPFFWVSQINAAYANALERRIKSYGIDMPRWRAMMSLYEDQYLSVSEIAEFSAQKLNTTTKVVQRMMSDGLVSTRVRPNDGRVTEVCLTNKGEKLRKEAFTEAQVIFQNTFEQFSEADLAALNTTLSKLHARLKKL